MSAPTGSDASTDSGESTGTTTITAPAETDDDPDLDDSLGATDTSDSLVEAATDWIRHWRAWGIATLSLAIVWWATLQPQRSPKGYIPIFVGFALMAMGYVYLSEETQVKFAST
jgi:hypothetical protein